MLTYIYIYMLVSGCKSSCTCVYVFLRVHGFFLFVCIHVYEYITVLFFFFYGVAGKEDRKIKQLNEKWTFSRLLYVYIIHMYIYTLDVSSFNNRIIVFCCCIRYNIQLSLRHALFNRSFLLFVSSLSFPNSLSSFLSLSHSFFYTDTQSHTYIIRIPFSPSLVSPLSRTLAPHSFL